MKFLVFLGTVRDSTPPRPARLGLRVAKAIMNWAKDNMVEHEFELIDPLDYSTGEVFKPHFAYAQGKAPEALSTLAEKIEAADGYVIVSPEYNHSMSPALADLLNHFGSSLYSFKPSVIATYSAGQWGGMRAAVAMRTFLSELGCLPVSAMIHVPHAQDAFDEDGAADSEQEDSWRTYFGRALSQMLWWAEATSNHRQEKDPFETSKAFKASPTQRNIN